MNVEMLLFLVELADGSEGEINGDAFFSRFPRSDKTYSDLDSLYDVGYISRLAADNDPYYLIYVTDKALRYRR